MTIGAGGEAIFSQAGSLPELPLPCRGHHVEGGLHPLVGLQQLPVSLSLLLLQPPDCGQKFDIILL